MKSAVRRPRGITLIETLVSMTLLMVALTIAGVIFELTLRLERTGREQQSRTIASFRLARAFRADVHAAATAAVPDVQPSGASLVLTEPDGTEITYERIKGRLTRFVREGPNIVARDAFPVAIARDPRFDVIREPDRLAIVRLALDESDPRAPRGTRLFAIEAALGVGLPPTEDVAK